MHARQDNEVQDENRDTDDNMTRTPWQDAREDQDVDREDQEGVSETVPGLKEDSSHQSEQHNPVGEQLLATHPYTK